MMSAPKGGRGSKNWPILRTNSTGIVDEGWGQKSRKSCGRHKWKPPKHVTLG